MGEDISLTPYYRRGGHGGAPHPPSYVFFFENRPIKTDAPPNGVHPPLKNEAPDLKNTSPPPPPLKRKAPFHEMIPRKSTINNNLKSS